MKNAALIVLAENAAALGAITWGTHALWGGPVAAITIGALVLALNTGASLNRRNHGA